MSKEAFSDAERHSQLEAPTGRAHCVRVLVEANVFIETARIRLQKGPVHYQRNTLHVAERPDPWPRRKDSYKGPTLPHTTRLLRCVVRHLFKSAEGGSRDCRAFDPRM